MTVIAGPLHGAAVRRAIIVIVTLLVPTLASAQAGTSPGETVQWWTMPVVLFLVTLALGMIAVVGGLGGGTIFVPIVSAFFPFHLDFVRAAGLLVALAGALAAGPQLLRMNLADLRLALPVALVASASAVVGARISFALPVAVLQVALGLVVFVVLAVMVAARRSDFPDVPAGDALSRRLGIMGAYQEASLQAPVEWRVHRTGLGLALFVVIGLMAGVFGIGAGWANVPVLNLVMGAPLKVAVGTSVFMLAITDTSAAWVYLHQGAVLPIVVVPSVVGMMVGSRLGVTILARARPTVVRLVIIAVLLFAGARSLMTGLRGLLGGPGVWS